MALRLSKRSLAGLRPKAHTDVLELRPKRIAKPQLSNFRTVKRFLERAIETGNREILVPYVGCEAKEAFRTVFPEVVASRGITNLKAETFRRYDYQNTVTVEPEVTTANHSADRHVDVLCVGGPSTWCAALSHRMRHPEKGVTHMAASRFDSNHDGSAFYYHERDAFPVYIHKVNQGPYCVFIDLYKRLISSRELIRQSVENPHHVKIGINWKNFMTNPQTFFTICLPNMYHSVMDMYIRPAMDGATLMQEPARHSTKTPEITKCVSENFGIPQDKLIIWDTHRAVYVGLNGVGTPPSEHFKHLQKYIDIPFHHVSTQRYGKFVDEVLNFPRDGMFNPWLLENVCELLNSLPGCSTERGMVLEKIFVIPDEAHPGQVKVSTVQMKNERTETSEIISVNKLFLSLGPSCKPVMRPRKYSLCRHLVDTAFGTDRSPQGIFYQPNAASFVRHAVNKFKWHLFRGKYLYKDCMLAAGSSVVLMVGVRKSAVSGDKQQVFRMFMDGVNQHWTLIAERTVELVDPEDESISEPWRFFAIQMTGGGNFPSRHTRPDFVLNLVANTEKMWGVGEPGLDPKDIMYDVVQVRGCGRSVSSRNTIMFGHVGTNCTTAYGLGGIGMTTMFPNGELQVQLQEYASRKDATKNDPLAGTDELTKGRIGDAGLMELLYGKNIMEGTDYRTMVDPAELVARSLGLNSTFSRTEKVWAGIGTLSGLSLLAFYVMGRASADSQ